MTTVVIAALGAVAVVLFAVVAYLLGTRQSADDTAAPAPTRPSPTVQAPPSVPASGPGPAGTPDQDTPTSRPQESTPAPTRPPGGSTPAQGTYTGTLSQRGTAGTSQDRDYPVEFVVSGRVITVRYPSLGCTGTLTPVVDSDDGIVRRAYTAHITVGACEDAGTWDVTKVSDARLDVGSHPTSGRYVVGGTLVR